MLTYSHSCMCCRSNASNSANHPLHRSIEEQRSAGGTSAFCAVYKPIGSSEIVTRSPPFATDVEAAYGADLYCRALVRPAAVHQTPQDHAIGLACCSD